MRCRAQAWGIRAWLFVPLDSFRLGPCALDAGRGQKLIMQIIRICRFEIDGMGKQRHGKTKTSGFFAQRPLAPRARPWWAQCEPGHGACGDRARPGRGTNRFSAWGEPLFAESSQSAADLNRD